MSLQISLPPETEQWLQDTARHEGLDPSALLAKIVERERQAASHLNRDRSLTAEETALLLQINLGLPEEAWQRYQSLLQRRRAEELAEDEQLELIKIADRIEAANVKRIEHLAALSRLRGVSIRELMDQLGIPRGFHA